MPDNAGYYEAAYTVAALVYLVYGALLVRRSRRLRARYDALTRDRA